MKEQENLTDNIERFSEEFSDDKFSGKIAKYAKKAGAKLVYVAYTLYYSLFDKNFPVKQRAIVIGALGYFILPIDLVPDIVPILGYSDDLAALLYAFKAVNDHITPEMKEKAKLAANKIFGNLDDKDLDLDLETEVK